MKFKRILKTDYFNFIKLNNLTKKLVSLVLSSIISLLVTYQCYALQICKNFFNNPPVIIDKDFKNYLMVEKEFDFYYREDDYDKNPEHKCLFIATSVYSTANNKYINIVYTVSEFYREFFFMFSQKKMDPKDIFYWVKDSQVKMKKLENFISKNKGPSGCINVCKGLLKTLSNDPTLKDFEDTDKVNNLNQIIKNYKEIVYQDVPLFLNSTKRGLNLAGRIGGPIAAIAGAGLLVAGALNPVGFVLFMVLGGCGFVGGLGVGIPSFILNYIKTDEQIKKEDEEDKKNRFIISQNKEKRKEKEKLKKEKEKLEKEIKLIKKKFVENSEKLFVQCNDVIKAIKLLESEPYDPKSGLFYNDVYGAIFFRIDRRNCSENLGVYLYFISNGNGRLTKFLECNGIPIEYSQKFPIHHADVEKISNLMYISESILKACKGSENAFQKKIFELQHKQLVEADERIRKEMVEPYVLSLNKATADSLNVKIKNIYSYVKQNKENAERNREIAALKAQQQAERDEKDRAIQAERDEKDRAIQAERDEKDRAIQAERDEKDRAIQAQQQAEREKVAALKAQLEGLVNYIMDKISYSKPVCISKLQRIFHGLNNNQINDIFELIRFIRDPNHGFNIELIIQARLNGYFTTITNEMAEFIKCIVSSHKTNP